MRLGAAGNEIQGPRKTLWNGVTEQPRCLPLNQSNSWTAACCWLVHKSDEIEVDAMSTTRRENDKWIEHEGGRLLTRLTCILNIVEHHAGLGVELLGNLWADRLQSPRLKDGRCHVINGENHAAATLCCRRCLRLIGVLWITSLMSGHFCQNCVAAANKESRGDDTQRCQPNSRCYLLAFTSVWCNLLDALARCTTHPSWPESFSHKKCKFSLLAASASFHFLDTYLMRSWRAPYINGDG